MIFLPLEKNMRKEVASIIIKFSMCKISIKVFHVMINKEKHLLE